MNDTDKPFTYANPNTFLRRADVEALLTGKIAACSQKIEGWNSEFEKLTSEQRLTENDPVALPLARRIADMKARQSSLMTALSHLSHTEQFTLADKQGQAVLQHQNGYAVQRRA